ncbi:hypothetical protein [Candidatus Berkiella aquae]|uniref:Uncharacterized protein n=1 Tax=Candidatus Berkiella aquae TaxID=295108 RepID=A0A0Q9YYQ7_9GAMM|nr:hypothetical protein [Candidatus Berkiella aquae]MCS5710413.1 hypothetical protein [Candidatus Berkiella aquae]
MKLFILTPFNPKWPVHQFKKLDNIIVRAASEAKARQLVKSVTFNSEKSKIGGQIHNPWQNPSFSKCEIYQGTDFSQAGKEEVLAPQSLNEHFKKLNK